MMKSVPAHAGLSPDRPAKRPAFPTCDEAFYWAEILSGVLEPQNLSSNGDVLPFNGASVAWKKLP